ncbi:hypothetical protein CFOL_v3_04903 [Cephalotus follicularis]|uniref:Integrase catalytic domain-containing protein n=1 Tax=Cephalotus follicularis TaxID=3775 RepID=A0A1Q3B038_CEPFO|nr:hypothetical protein CFOL_v3_04903 [Cephalotus follicularis]
MGVEHQPTVSYTPEQNRVLEQKNRTVMEMSRCMLAEKKMPKRFWAEAVHTIVYLQNRLPVRALQNKTPIEAWAGVKPSERHLRVFGSICYFNVPENKNDKLTDKAEKRIFLGYNNQSKGYRIYNLRTNKITVSSDVKVDESSHWKWPDVEVEAGVVVHDCQVQPTDEKVTNFSDDSVSEAIGP